MKSRYDVPELYAIGVIEAWIKQNHIFDYYDVFNFVKDMLNSDIKLTDEFEMFISTTISRCFAKQYVKEGWTYV